VTLERLQRLALGLWELPQNVLGAAVYGVLRVSGRVRSTEHARGRLFVEADGVAISLGWFVYWCRPITTRYFHIDRAVKEHEFGHTFQSRWLGPLYLPVVGVPSTLRNAYQLGYRELTGRRWEGYFDGFPEKWADDLAGLDRAALKLEWPRP